jgi:RNA polymerase sigma-70 factor, ECF subfamily
MEKTAFAQLLRRHRDRVFSHAWYVLRNREDAEDVVQEVFSRLWTHGDGVDPDRASAWILRVAHNACIDTVRRRRPHSGTETLESECAAGASDDPWNPADPEQAFAFHEAQKSLLDAMECLPEMSRSLLLLHYFQGLPYETVGEIAGMSTNAVKVAIHRARKSLKRVLVLKNPDWVEERTAGP